MPYLPVLAKNCFISHICGWEGWHPMAWEPSGTSFSEVHNLTTYSRPEAQLNSWSFSSQKSPMNPQCAIQRKPEAEERQMYLSCTDDVGRRKKILSSVPYWLQNKEQQLISRSTLWEEISIESGETLVCWRNGSSAKVTRKVSVN